MPWNLDHSYTQLPEPFFARVKPVPVEAPTTLLLNRRLAEELGLEVEALKGAEGARLLAGCDYHPSSEPLAQGYAGHQFGNFTLLGDGRAHLLGEQLAPDGRRVDIQLKGSGATPYSRRGDGRAALGPMLREYIISEAMHGLGIPTTRSLAVVATGEAVYRETALPGAVLTRVSESHIRVGTFQFAAALDAGVDVPGHPGPRAEDGTYTRALADYTLQRHFPELLEKPNRYAELLRAVMERQAALVAEWMRVGFIHGVMNTDNVSIAGETIDYGPCAFIDTYDPEAVFSSIDIQGRYRFGNQARIAQWNLARLAETLLPLLDTDPKRALAMAEELIGEFPAMYEKRYRKAMGAKLGLASEAPEDTELLETLLDWMKRTGADYTNTFRDLASTAAIEDPAELGSIFKDAAFEEWHAKWRGRLSRESGGIVEAIRRMQTSNPAIIPRNHRVEEAITAAVESGDLEPTQQLLTALAEPYSTVLDNSRFREPPKADERIYQTFCGT